MQIGASNISWEITDNPQAFKMLKESGFDYVESVYSKISEGFPVKSIQSLFYDSGINDLDDSAVEHIESVIDRCEAMGIKAITFGSPNMRVGHKNKMYRFLNSVDEFLDGKSVKFCIEPNAKYYGAEYYNTLEEIVQDLPNYVNICSMIDVGNSILEGQNPIEEYDRYSSYVSHIHFAAKDLNEIQDYEIYRDFYNHLLNNNYNGLLTYEFGKTENLQSNLQNFIKNIKG